MLMPGIMLFEVKYQANDYLISAYVGHKIENVGIMGQRLPEFVKREAKVNKFCT